MSARLEDNKATTNAYQMFIDGKWCDAKAGGILEVINPTTGEAHAGGDLASLREWVPVLPLRTLVETIFTFGCS